MDEQALDGREAVPRSVPLLPLSGGTAGKWSVEFEEDLLSLLAADGRTVLMLPRAEAARHIRFEWDLVRGRTVSFSLAEGMRGHRFRCGREALRALLEWLPQKPEADHAREVRRYAVAWILFGTLILLFPGLVFAGWGLACVLLGVVNVLHTRRAAFVFNGMALAVLGAMVLFLPLPEVFTPTGPARYAELAATAAGAVLLIWGVQQFSLCTPMQRVHVARTEGHVDVGAPARSRLVLAVSAAAFVLAVLMALHLAGIYGQARSGDTFAPMQDLVLYAAPMVVLLGAGVLLLARRRPPYVEAQITGQFALVLLVLYGTGLGACLAAGESAFPAGALRTGVTLAVRLYVWVPVVLAVLGFNRWFAQRVRREVEARLE